MPAPADHPSYKLATLCFPCYLPLPPAQNLRALTMHVPKARSQEDVAVIPREGIQRISDGMPRQKKLAGPDPIRQGRTRRARPDAYARRRQQALQAPDDAPHLLLVFALVHAAPSGPEHRRHLTDHQSRKGGGGQRTPTPKGLPGAPPKTRSR